MRAAIREPSRTRSSRSSVGPCDRRGAGTSLRRDDRAGDHRERARAPAGTARSHDGVRRVGSRGVGSPSRPLAKAIEERGLASVLLLVPSGEEAKSLEGLREPPAAAGGTRGAPRRRDPRAGRWRRGGPGGFRGLHLHARDPVHPDPHDVDRAGGRGDRGQVGGEPPGREEPRRHVRPAPRGPGRRRRARDPRRAGLPIRAGRGGEVRAHARRRSSSRCWRATPLRSSRATRS